MRQTVLTQIRLSLHCLHKNVPAEDFTDTFYCDKRFSGLRDFFPKCNAFYEKCADPDEKSYYTCGNSSWPSLFAKVPLLGESTKGKNRIT